MEKLKTIGDSYFYAGGLPVPNDTHPADAVTAALQCLEYLEGLKSRRRYRDGGIFEMRFGVHTGPVAAGVVGTLKFAYDLWGHTVNIAKRLERASLPVASPS